MFSLLGRFVFRVGLSIIGVVFSACVGATTVYPIGDYTTTEAALSACNQHSSDQFLSLTCSNMSSPPACSSGPSSWQHVLVKQTFGAPYYYCGTDSSVYYRAYIVTDCPTGYHDDGAGACVVDPTCPVLGTVTTAVFFVDVSGIPGFMQVEGAYGVVKDEQGCGLTRVNAPPSDCREFPDGTFCIFQAGYTGAVAPVESVDVEVDGNLDPGGVETREQVVSTTTDGPTQSVNGLGETVTTTSVTLLDVVSAGATVTESGGTFSVYKWGQNSTTSTTTTSVTAHSDGSSTTSSTKSDTAIVGPYSVVTINNTSSVANYKGTTSEGATTTVTEKAADGTTTSSSTTSTGSNVAGVSVDSSTVEVPELPADVPEFSDTLNEAYETLRDGPLLTALDDASNISVPAGSCPAGSVSTYLFEVDFSGMCTLFEQVAPILSVVIKAGWALLAVWVFFMA